MMFSIKIFGTRVRANKAALPVIFASVLGVVTFLEYHWHPERGLWENLAVGFVTTILLLVVEFGHDVAHIFSARRAGAPMDEILISWEMPRTLYSNNTVPPDVHRMRALGGPVFNGLGLLSGLAVYAAAPGNSIVRELAGWWALGHALQLMMSLAPLPPVDGGTLLKWTLVSSGRTEQAADEIVRRVDWGMGIGAAIAGIGLLALQFWIAGAILLGISLVVIWVTAGKVR